MTFREWFSSFTAEQTHVFNLDGAGFPRDPIYMMELAWNAAFRAGMAEAARICDGMFIPGEPPEHLDNTICAQAIRAELEGTDGTGN